MKMRLNKVRFLMILMLLCALQVDAINVRRVSQGDVFNNKVDTVPTMYIIEGDCSLSGDVTLAPGSILKFEGGAINGIGTIKSSQLMIDAPKYQIFGENVNFENNVDPQKDAIANGEVSAHWWGAKGDGKNYDCGAINRALKAAGSSWVVLDNLKYLTNETLVLGENQKLRCDGILSYRGDGAAIELTEKYIELDIFELRQNAGWEGQTTPYKGSGVLFSGNVYHANIDIDKIYYFDKAFNLMPNANCAIQYCKISWQYVVGEYGVYIDISSGAKNAAEEDRMWVNENQFNGGRLRCNYGVYSTPIGDDLNDIVGLINGNVFNSIGFEGDIEGKFKCKAITLYNAWHNNFNDIRLSEGYVPIGQPWIDLTQCGYLNFDFKSLIPYSSVKATRCNHIEIEGAICDDALGYFKEFDKMYVLNENTMYNPLNIKEDDNFACNGDSTFKFVSRDFVPSAEFKVIYIDSASFQGSTNRVKNINFEDLYYTLLEGLMEMSDKCFIKINDNSTLNIYTQNSIASSYLEFMLVCVISNGSKIIMTDNEGKTITLTESGVYYVRPIGGTFQLFRVYDSGYEIKEFE